MPNKKFLKKFLSKCSRNAGFRSVTSLVLLFVIFLPLYSTYTDAEESMLATAPIFIDNQPVKTKYSIRDGQLMVSALFLKHTGVKVNWNETYRSIVISNGEHRLALPVGKNFYDYYQKTTNTWKRHPLPTNTIELEGEVFIPLVDVVKKLGMHITYNPKLERTFITTNIPSAPAFIYKGNPSKKLVALTFDDGPDAFYTPQILDILKEKHVPATFFVLGKQVKANPQVMKRIVKEGHGLGNHTWNHKQLPRVMTSELIAEIQSTQQEMEKTVGRKPDLFRPPYGALTKSDALVLREMGLRVVMWSVDTLDWSGLSAEDILANVQRDISPGGIILQHNFQADAGRLTGTVEALPRIIEDLQAKGYQFVTIQTLLDNR